MNHHLRNTCRAGVFPAALVFLSLTCPAHAHMTVEGAGDFGNGALHPLMTAPHALILLGLGLLLGQQVPLNLKTPMLVFAPASAAALFLTTTGKVNGVYQPVLLGIALCLAALVALGLKPGTVISAVLSGMAAIGIGLDSGFHDASAAVVAKTLLGTWVVMNALTGYLALCASNADGRPWAKTGIRIVGSWIIAITLLILAFALKK